MDQPTDFAVVKAPAHLVPPTTDVMWRAVFLAAGNGDVSWDVLTLDQDPSYWALSTSLVEVASTALGGVQPVREVPHVLLFLNAV